MTKLTVGTEVYYTGDMANSDGFGIIAKIIPGNKYDPDMTVVHLEDGRDLTPYMMGIADTYEGHGGVRFVTKEAYDTWRQASIAEMQQQWANMQANA